MKITTKIDWAYNPKIYKGITRIEIYNNEKIFAVSKDTSGVWISLRDIDFIEEEVEA